MSTETKVADGSSACSSFNPYAPPSESAEVERILKDYEPAWLYRIWLLGSASIGIMAPLGLTAIIAISVKKYSTGDWIAVFVFSSILAFANSLLFGRFLYREILWTFRKT